MPLQGSESRWIATSGRKTRVTTNLDMAAHLDTLGWDVIEVVPAEGMVPRSEAEALAEALESMDAHYSGSLDFQLTYVRCDRDALEAYRASHPKETP